MHKAADAATNIAQLALNAERPFVFVESQMMIAEDTPEYLGVLGGRDKPSEPTLDLSVFFDLRNRGRGIAIIKQVATRLLTTEGISSPNSVPRRFTTMGKETLQRMPRTNVISAGEAVSGITVKFKFLKHNWESVISLRTYLMFISLVTYQDVFKRRYVTRAFFGYYPPPPPLISASGPPMRLHGQLFIGADRHNRFT